MRLQGQKREPDISALVVLPFRVGSLAIRARVLAALLPQRAVRLERAFWFLDTSHLIWDMVCDNDDTPLESDPPTSGEFGIGGTCSWQYVVSKMRSLHDLGVSKKVSNRSRRSADIVPNS